MGYGACDSIVHLAYIGCGDTDDLEYLVDINTHVPHVTTIALQH